MELESRARRLQRIAENLDREAALDLAAHTIINIQDQKTAANVLFEKGLFGQARSAAITALEELGKLVATMNYLAGSVDAPTLINNVWSHQSKQRTGYLVMMFAPLVLHLQKRNNGEPQDQSAMALYQKLDEHILENTETLIDGFQRRLPELEQLVREVETGEIEFRRQDGLYVSLAIDNSDEISIKYPRLVTREDAALVIELLSMFNADTVGTALDQLVNHYAEGTGDGDDLLAVAIPMIRKMMDDATNHLRQTLVSE